MESADADLPSMIWSNYMGDFHKNVQSLWACDCESNSQSARMLHELLDLFFMAFAKYTYCCECVYASHEGHK